MPNLLMRKKMPRNYFLTLVFSFFLIGASAQKTESLIATCNQQLAEVIMEDLFTPPVSTRVMAYPNIAFYEVLCFKYPQMRSMAGQLNGLTRLWPPADKIDVSLAAMIAFNTVAKKLLYSEYMIDSFQQRELRKWNRLHPESEALLNSSLSFGTTSGNHIIDWMKKDNYDHTRTLMRYVVVDSAGSWQPTSPDYGNAIEPNWPLMRSFVFNEGTMIHAVMPTSYSEEKGSAFYRGAMDLYLNSKKADTTQHLIAWFWDDNPNITRSAGHMTYYIHKYSPGAHWMRLTAQTLKQLKMDEVRGAQTFLLVSIALYEGFIACWTDKYLYNRVRPETYINKLIDPKWRSYIETPPFPEYPSGHSVISGSASTILMKMIPQPYSFVDSTVRYIGMPARRFSSFKKAADETSISRFYGGIHFKEALDNGLDQGRKIGAYILDHIKLTN